MVSQFLKSRGPLRGLIPWSWGFPGLQRKLQWMRKSPEDWSRAQCMSTARERKVGIGLEYVGAFCIFFPYSGRFGVSSVPASFEFS